MRLCVATEVVLFTAGLEDYAKPICDELDGRYGGAFHARLYRPATTACAAYPCLKVGLSPFLSFQRVDMGRRGECCLRIRCIQQLPNTTACAPCLRVPGGA